MDAVNYGGVHSHRREVGDELVSLASTLQRTLAVQFNKPCATLKYGIYHLRKAATHAGIQKDVVRCLKNLVDLNVATSQML